MPFVSDKNIQKVVLIKKIETALGDLAFKNLVLFNLESDYNRRTFTLQGRRGDSINNLSKKALPWQPEKCIWDIKGWWERGSLRFVGPRGIPWAPRLVALAKHECFMRHMNV